ncbi:hypothetical protein [Paenibacillus taichungensis]|uniref:hypothetical protein n=1 Tax=Paenibacillus taichungensis TaxID=484184 RepID=UPI0039A506CF
MTITDLWNQFKDVFADLVKYGFPTVAIIVSLLSFKDSRKANKVRDRLNELEEKLKQFALEEKEKARLDETKASIEARIINISKGKYKLKIWNSGKATAYNVNLEIPDEFKGIIYTDKVPYEFLEAGKNFEEHILVHSGTPRKFTIKTTWEDSKGINHLKELILTI